MKPKPKASKHAQSVALEITNSLLEQGLVEAPGFGGPPGYVQEEMARIIDQAGSDLLAALTWALRYVRIPAYALPEEWAAEYNRARALTKGEEAERCAGCGRESLDCSINPCADVISDRGE